MYGHYAGGCEQILLGRTPTILQFQEVTYQSQTRMLRVLYEWEVENGDIADGKGWIEYIHSDETSPSGPLERKVCKDSKWVPLTYSRSWGTYVSAHMMDNNNQNRPLPNKVSQCEHPT